jgi:hypothetical protein
LRILSTTALILGCNMSTRKCIQFNIISLNNKFICLYRIYNFIVQCTTESMDNANQQVWWSEIPKLVLLSNFFPAHTNKQTISIRTLRLRVPKIALVNIYSFFSLQTNKHQCLRQTFWSPTQTSTKQKNGMPDLVT